MQPSKAGGLAGGGGPPSPPGPEGAAAGGRAAAADGSLLREVSAFLTGEEDARPPGVGAGGAASPIFDPATIAAAVLDLDGTVIRATAAFRRLALEGADLERLARAAEGASQIVTAGSGDEGVLQLYARASRTTTWPLPPEIRQAAVAAPHQVVLIACHIRTAAEALEAACDAYGLSPAQTRVVIQTIRSGAVKTAAAALGVSFHTARQTLAEAMARTRVSRMPALVRRICTLAFGVLPPEGDSAAAGEIWGLTDRQVAVAALVANGLTRPDVARALGLSVPAVNRALEEVFLLLEVNSAAALARKLVEANALKWLTQSTGGDVGFMERGAEPLKLAHRADGSQIAVSDYGPASNRPLLFAHTVMTTRVMARGLVRALQAAGYRPISIDRPGFGQTDPVAGARPGRHDPFVTAAEDAVLVMDSLKIRQADAVVRGAARFALALDRMAPGRLGRVVLINPSLVASADRRDTGLFGQMKAVFQRNPAMIRLFVATLTRDLTYERFLGTIRGWMRGSPPDEAAIEDPELMRDHFRAQRMFATGSSDGFVNEQIAYANGSPPAPRPGLAHWTVLVGAHDTLYEPADVAAYWRRALPDSEVRVVPDAGRLLAFSHPHHVVDALGG